MTKLKIVKVMSEQEKRLSYQYSLWQMLGHIMMAIVFSSLTWERFRAKDIEWSFFDFLTLFVAAYTVALSIYQLLYLCTAHVKQDKIVFKKFFRAEQIYVAKQIIKVKKYNLGRVHYTVVTMQNSTGITDKYMIINVYSWYAQSRYDAKEILDELQNKR